jgi:hypothetical protein
MALILFFANSKGSTEPIFFDSLMKRKYLNPALSSSSINF